MKKFLLGIFLGLIGVELIQTIGELIITFLEIPKASISKKILKENAIIQKLQINQEEVHTQAIGFEIPSAEEDDDFDDRKNNKIKLGFH